MLYPFMILPPGLSPRAILGQGECGEGVGVAEDEDSLCA